MEIEKKKNRNAQSKRKKEKHNTYIHNTKSEAQKKKTKTNSRLISSTPGLTRSSIPFIPLSLAYAAKISNSNVFFLSSLRWMGARNRPLLASQDGSHRTKKQQTDRKQRKENEETERERERKERRIRTIHPKQCVLEAPHGVFAGVVVAKLNLHLQRAEDA
jgi:hypothetical protein